MQITEPDFAPTSPRRFRARYDVTHVVDEPGHWFISAECLMPATTPEAGYLTVLCCTPGGGCTGSYFDLGEPEAGFSFAAYAAAAGFACILVDNLATGQSTPGADPWVSPHSVVRASTEAFARVAEELRTLLPASVTVATVGIGHSMGAMLTLMAQAMTSQHAAIVCLGFTPAGLPGVLSPDELRVAAAGPVSLKNLDSMARKRFSESRSPIAAERVQEPFPFQLADTSPAALTALAATSTNLLPLPATLSLLPGNVVDYICEITVPVFLGGGDHEPWHQAAELVPVFEKCNDITFYTLVDAAHNHNVANTRELLWRRILGWAGVVATDRALTL